MTDILDLPGWDVASSTIDGDEYIIEASCSIEPDACTVCGVVGRLYKHGRKKVRYRDSPIRGFHSVLVASVQRYKCRDCEGTFLQPVTEVDANRRMTVRCREYIEEQSLKDTFTNVARHVGCDEKTVRSIAKVYTDDLNSAFNIYAPEWLGIDEVHVAGSLRCILTDVGNRTPIDFLQVRNRPVVERWLYNLPGKNDIEGVTIDMWRPYRDLVRAVIPDAAVVVDKYHVIAMVNRCMDRVRKAVGNAQTNKGRRLLMRSRHMLLKRPENLTDKQAFALDGWLQNVPELNKAYQIKEAFFDIYKMDRADAQLAIREWPDMIPKHLAAHFKEVTTALGNWEREIMEYFTHPYTNAYTEALNGVTKVINRQGRGYTFDVLRARLLFRYQQKQDDFSIEEVETILPSVKRRNIQMARAYAISKQEMRCWSCNGLFEHSELEVHHLKSWSDPYTTINDAVALCAECHQRIHE